MILVAKSYWGQMPFWFRGRANARVESLVLRTEDFRQIRANLWLPESSQKPKIGVVLMHPRVDFTHHYAVPRLVQAGFAVLAANSRHVGNDTACEHEELVHDLAACVKWLTHKAGVARVVLFGNSGGGSLAGFYQAQAKLPPAERIEKSPGGSPTRFASSDLKPADALVLVAAHRGQGHVLAQTIDPSVVDERDAFKTDRALDMYDENNGFREPPASSSYSLQFLEQYRSAQVARVKRIDETARALIADQAHATAESDAPEFAARPLSDRTRVLRRKAHEPVMIVNRTMANPKYTDLSLDAAVDPSAPTKSAGREYGSLLSDRPDLMNMAQLGFARTVTPRAWLSTWSVLSSNADLAKNITRVTEPTLIVHAERDREVYFDHDIAPVFEAAAASDKTLVRVDARHYFEPDFGEKTAPDVDRLLDVVVPWIEKRFS